MDKPIMLTPQDMVTIIIAVCGAIITVSGAVTIIVNLIKKAHEPENAQNKRISSLEEWRIDVDRKLDMDKRRLDNIEYGHEVTQEVLLALVNYQLTEDKDELKAAKKKLELYLVARKKTS
jgi:formyltetrahydrofolate synthetase